MRSLPDRAPVKNWHKERGFHYQIVMGWTDSHLHEFTIGDKRYTEYPESKEDGLSYEIPSGEPG